MRVVFDTNVVASASFWKGPPHDCLVAWARGEFHAFVSAPLLAEYFETIEELRADYPKLKPVEWAQAMADAAEMIYPAVRLRELPKDPDDVMVLECAVAAEADYLVTGDKKHLLPLKAVRGVRIVTPADFLVALKAAADE